MTRRRTASTVVLASAAVAAAIVVALSTNGGTFALLTAGATTPAGPNTITSGSAGLTLGSLTLSGTPLYPGATAYGVATARNTGDVSLDLSVEMTRPGSTTTGKGATSARPDVAVALGTTTSATVCRAGNVQSTWSGSLDSGSPTPAGITLRPGAVQVLCVALTMPRNAPASQQSLSTDFTMTITGTQA